MLHRKCKSPLGGVNVEREWLKALRGDRPTAEVAAQMGITKQYYNYIENGKRQKKMDIQLCEKISEIFGVPIATIIEYERNSDK